MQLPNVVEQLTGKSKGNKMKKIQCVTCGLEKTEDDYTPSVWEILRKTGEGSYKRKCKVCIKKYTDANQRAKNIQRLKDIRNPDMPDTYPTTLRHCTVCKKFKANKHFHKNSNGINGRGTQCKPCLISVYGSEQGSAVPLVKLPKILQAIKKKAKTIIKKEPVKPALEVNDLHVTLINTIKETKHIRSAYVSLGLNEEAKKADIIIADLKKRFIEETLKNAGI